MKQLFFNILTKVTPDLATQYGFVYNIKIDDKDYHVEITWCRTKEGEPKLEWLSPFKEYLYPFSSDFKTPRLYLLYINGRNYEIPLTELERCEVDKAIISVYEKFQKLEANALNDYIKGLEPETATERLQKAQEDVVNNNE